MKTETIINKLSELLRRHQIEVLQKICSKPGDIELCLKITDIIRDYDSSKENKQRVSNLLALLCKNHFVIVKNKSIKKEEEFKTGMSNIKFSDITYQLVKYYPEKESESLSKKSNWGISQILAFYQREYKRYQVVAIDGYGRTNHVILRYFDNVKEFENVDAPKYWKKIYSPSFITA